ncbi:TfoX/Sxy family protein [Paludisphaera mucosa]|uniref:TfoX/Sxy family protein n=1 Tax=Paludisphaera mucosa TaxID=3030827 RepID=A0ABT6FA58_9BACT|nr:TfoX/Sxy family protein [Paludisphaera mucosa]MDG3004473.1 TfoX/Sxy family protein [Paludisphaera mucosa]
MPERSRRGGRPASREKPSQAWFVDVLERLSPLGEVTSRAMFGGRGIYQRGRIFALAFRERLYFKVDVESEPEYLAAGMGPFRPSERQTLKSYYEVPQGVLGDPELLVSWAAEAIRAAQRSARR